MLASGVAECIGTDHGALKMTDLEQVSHQEKVALPDHRSALLRVIRILSTGADSTAERLDIGSLTEASISATRY
jgi:hypothetical protein